MYGLSAVGPGPKEQRRMQAVIIKHARAMAKSYAHIHHESSQNVLARCGIRNATEQLHKETEALLRRLRAQLPQAPIFKEEHLLDLRQQAAILQADTIKPELEELHPSLDMGAHSCETCGRIFSSFRLLRSHEAKHHKRNTPAPSTTPFNRLEHRKDGLPTCRHCGHRFRQWANLIQHVQRDRCQILRRRRTISTQSGPETPMTHPREVVETKLDDQGLVPPVQALPDSDAPGASNPPPCPVPDHSEPLLGAQTSDSERHIPPDLTSASHTADEADLKIPLQAWPIVRQHLEAGTWVQLLTMSTVQDYLAHHCPICLQWAATPAGIKCHMTHHPDDWTLMQPDVRALLRGFQTPHHCSVQMLPGSANQ